MNTPISAKRLATAAIGAAVALLAVVAAFYTRNLSTSLNVVAGIGLLIPLSQKYYKESILAYIAVCGLGAIFVNIYILNFVLITGLYTIAATFMYDKKIKWYIVVALGVLYGCFCFFILYKVAAVVSIDIARLRLGGLSAAVIYAILNATFLLALAAYHYFMIWIGKYIGAMVSKIIK